MSLNVQLNQLHSLPAACFKYLQIIQHWIDTWLFGIWWAELHFKQFVMDFISDLFVFLRIFSAIADWLAHRPESVGIDV